MVSMATVAVRTLGQHIEELHGDLWKRLEGSKDREEIEAGAEISVALANMRVVYSNEMSTLITLINQTVQSHFDQAEALVGMYKRKEQLCMIQQKVEDFVKELPFKGLPQLSHVRVRPLYAEDSGIWKFGFNCKGRFPHFPEPRDDRYKATLKFSDGAPRSASEASVNSLVFVCHLKAQEEVYSVVLAQLSVPREAGAWRAWPVGEVFSIYVAIPPLKIGYLTFNYVVPRLTGEIKEGKTQIYSLVGDDKKPSLWKEQSYSVRAEDGYAVVPGSIALQIEPGTVGSYKVYFFRLKRGTSIEMRAGVAAQETDLKSRVNFSLRFKMMKGVMDESIDSPLAPIKWGEAKNVPMSMANRWLDTVVLKTIQGDHFTFNPGSSSAQQKSFVTAGQAPNPYMYMSVRPESFLHIETRL